MWRMSAPPLSRCVAALWRKVWQVACFAIPAFWAQDRRRGLKASLLDPPAALGEEEKRRTSRATHPRPAAQDVLLDRFGGRARQGYVSVLAPFAEQDAKKAVFGVHVAELEACEFAGADARRVESLQDRAVA